MPYVLPDLDYDYDALAPHISARILELHHAKHHAAYVDTLNSVLDSLESARAADDFSALAGLEHALAFNLGGHVLHSLYWKNLSPDGGGAPEGDLASALGEHFGGFEPFRAQMTAATVGVTGSGWGALCWDPRGAQLLVTQVHDHQDGVVPGAIPLLVIDAWEHAYYLQYENRRTDYVDAVWNVVHWADVEERLKTARDST